MRRVRCATASIVAALALLAACDQGDVIADPPPSLTLDQQLRASLGGWGAVPILPAAAQDPRLVELGRALFFDKELSGNRDVACASCHDPATTVTDGSSLGAGTGGIGHAPTRTPGSGRRHIPRNAPSLLNQGLGSIYMFWDGRLNEEGHPGQFRAPGGIALPPGLANLLAAQATLPVLDRGEMRGERGDRDRFGNPNELAEIDDAQPSVVWSAVMRRLLAIPEYRARFAAAYPTTSPDALGYQHAANAIAAFQIHNFTRTDSPFDRYLQRDDRALSDEAKRGGILFFGRALCASCHAGPLLGGQGFANIGVPQLGPGVGTDAPLDIGRGAQIRETQFYRFAFRIPPLRNVELTAPYMHNGAYPTLEAVVRHYSNVDSALVSYDVSQLPPALRGSYHGDQRTIDAMRATLDGRLRQLIQLTEQDRRDLVAFLRSLTDPSARNLGAIVPAAVPSGLPVRE
jgi:cytochrome c peroxidase